MYILGINAGHTATACLLKDGEVIGCISEERFSRIKNHSGFPRQAVKYLLELEKIGSCDLDMIVMDNNFKKDPFFEKKFLQAYTKKSRKDKILSKVGYKFPYLFSRYLKIKRPFFISRKKKNADKIKKKVSHIMGVPESKIEIADHHTLHAMSCCFNLPPNKKNLIFTLDGEGDGLCASVNLFDGKKFETISRTNKSASLGYLYSIATIFLGMKPLQHEFKVMGLAPYAKSHNVDKIYPLFEKLISVNSNLEFVSKFNMPFADHFFREEMEFVRFDVIAGAVQKLVEEKTVEWVLKSIRKTGIKNVSLSGGVFMNVKANQKISKLKEVKDFFVMPSCGDESNAIGACFYGYLAHCQKNNLKFSVKPIKHLYLGPKYDDMYIERLISENNLFKKYDISRPKEINKEIARLLASGEIVARCSGRSEWGARALGNRSILANPRNRDTVRILNETIKDRDFWMPFTPSILDRFEKIYIKNPKKIDAYYMIVTFDSTEKAKEDLPAAMHPYDFTLRPQIVRKEHNKDYYQILTYFEKFTGCGGILNTSFNLHGEPNVLTPEDALHTVENSDIKYLAMENYLFKKK